jgi:hypothetical protein
VILTGWALPVLAQVTPAAGSTPPDDTQVIRVGATLFANYTYQTDPSIIDAAGNSVHFNSFDVTRGYINVTGNISHILAFRITPDITREAACPAATCSTSGSLVFRMKYGYLQTNLDDWMTRGSYARFGIHQTPYLDYTEGIYRYRFQGTMFIERVGQQSSADAGVSFHYNFPSNYGDIHVGGYNGENYNKLELNDQKAFKIRITVRPFATQAPVLRGLRVSGYWDGDHIVANAERQRAVGHVTYEHDYIVGGFEYLDAHNQTLPTAANVHSNGYSAWVIPRIHNNGTGLEGLIRYDHYTPNTSTAFASVASAGNAFTTLDSQKQNRWIVGVAYWFPHPSGGATGALLLDYDGQQFDNQTALPTKLIAIHALINF